MLSQQNQILFFFLGQLVEIKKINPKIRKEKKKMFQNGKKCPKDGLPNSKEICLEISRIRARLTFK